MTSCPVCNSRSFAQIDFIEDVPVFLNRRWPTAAAAIAADVGTLSMQRCQDCGFVWNATFDSSRVVYDQFYENDQTHSITFRNHLQNIADRVIAAAGGRPFHLLEIGCGQGIFLNELAVRAGDLLTSATGYDPAYRGEDNPTNNTRIVREYFTRETAGLMKDAPNIVVTRHTIEHVPEPVQFLSNIRDAIEGDATILIETPDVDWILSRGEVQDLFYEHCSLFDENSMRTAMELAGWRPVNVDRVFGGQYLCAVGSASNPYSAAKESSRKAQGEQRFNRRKFTDRWRKALQTSPQPVALWGAGAKGVTFALLTDPNRELITAVVDINPEKQGCFLPKSGIPIVSPRQVVEFGIQTVFAMNPNYSEEIAAQLRSIGSKATVIAVDGRDRR